jgi:hypothetical protein
VKLGPLIFYAHRPNTGSLLYLTAIICHFLLLICHTCGWLAEWDTLIQWINQQEVVTDISEIK